MSGLTALERLAASACDRSASVAARRIARQSLLDTAACIAAGWDAPQTRAALQARALTGAAGAGEVALILGTAAHALDYDDYEAPGSTHPSAVLVAVILALSTRRRITLEEAEAAYLAGYETILALGLTLGYGHYMAGWHATATLGGIGAAATASHLLGLGQCARTSALSLAVTQAAGLKVQFGQDAKALHAGLAARNGLAAASLAGAGAGAVPDAFEAVQGFAALYAPAGTAAALPERLPTILDHPPYRKAAPACGYVLRAIDAACEIAARPGFDPSEIETTAVHIAAPYFEVVRHRAPVSAAEARFSLSRCVAIALCDRHVGQGHFSDAALRRADLSALEARVTAHPYPLPPGAGDVSPEAPDRVEVTLRDGRRLSAVCAVAPGAPERPLDDAALIAKATECGLAAEQARGFLALRADTVLSGAALLPDPLWVGISRPDESST